MKADDIGRVKALRLLLAKAQAEEEEATERRERAEARRLSPRWWERVLRHA